VPEKTLRLITHDQNNVKFMSSSQRTLTLPTLPLTSFVRTLAALPAVAACFLGSSLHAGIVVIDDFSAGTSFTLANPGPTNVNFIGAGPLGGGRQITMASVFGANTSSLNTTTGTFSTAITGYSDAFLRWGSANSNNPVALNITGAQSFIIEFDSFSLGAGDAGGGNDGVFLQYFDNVNLIHSFSLSGASISTLAANNGGVLSVSLSSFSGGLYTGPIQGFNLGFDDRDLSATVTKVSVMTSSAVPDSSGTVPLLLLGLAGIIFVKRSRNRNNR
jgi:hypothetical protein